MGLLEQEIKELRQMNKMFQDGKIKSEDVLTKIAIYSQVERRAKLLLQALTIGAKYGARAMKAVHTSNIIGEGSYIDIGMDQETDKISCPGQKCIITRGECLDLSGDGSNFSNTCAECSHFAVTRNMLLAPIKKP